MVLRLPLLTCMLCCSLLWAQSKQIAAYQQQVASVGPLTDELVLKYIAAQKALLENGAQFTSHMSGQKKQKDGHQKFEGIVQSAGFSDYAEFLKVNARVAWAFNMAQGQLGIAQYDEQLANPEVPEGTKKELRKAELRAIFSGLTPAQMQKIQDATASELNNR